jgi:hypothetical protein
MPFVPVPPTTVAVPDPAEPPVQVIVVAPRVMDEVPPATPFDVPEGAVPPAPTVIDITFPALPVRILIAEPPPPPPPVIVDAAEAPLPPPPITVTLTFVTPAGNVKVKVPVPVLTIGAPELLVTVVGYTAVAKLEKPVPAAAVMLPAIVTFWLVSIDRAAVPLLV